MAKIKIYSIFFGFILPLSCSDMIDKGIEATQDHNLKVEITSHKNNDYDAAEFILTGEARTLDGIEIIDDTLFSWYSDTDGFLGTGRELELAAALTPGENIVSLEVADIVTGAEGRESVTLNVGNVFSEDFKSTDYFDRDNSSAIWNYIEGEVTLGPYEDYTCAGSFDTDEIDSGSALGIAVSGDYAYIVDDLSSSCDAYGLVIVDINPESADYLTEIASYNTDGKAKDIAVSGDYAYIADGDYGLVVVNISNPASPADAGSCDTAGTAYGIALDTDNDLAYIADYTNGLVIIKISTLTEVGSCDTNGLARKVTINGDYAYVADLNEGLAIIDINTSSSDYLTIVDTCDIDGKVYDVDVSDDYAYVADIDNRRIAVIDINPESADYLNIIGSCYTGAGVTDVTVSGNYAYIADRANGFIVIDVSDPKFPYNAGNYNCPASDIAVTEEYAYVAANRDGLVIINLSYPCSLISGFIPGDVDFRTVAIDENYAYIGDYDASTDKFVIIDISNHNSPSYVSSLITDGYVKDIIISGELAYITDTVGLKIIDISDIENPAEIASCNTDGSASDLAISGDYAYVADGDNGVVVIDINPDNGTYMTIVNSNNTIGSVGEIEIYNNIGYLQVDTVNIVSIDLDTGSSTYLDVIDTYTHQPDPDSSVSGISVSGNYLFISDNIKGDSSNAGLAVIGINSSNGELISKITSCKTAGSARDIKISGNYAYVLNSNQDGSVLLEANGLAIIDISDPENVTDDSVAATCHTDGEVKDLYVTENYAYIADGDYGLTIINRPAKFTELYTLNQQIVRSESVADVNATSVRIYAESEFSIYNGFLIFEVSNNGEDWFYLTENYRLEFPTLSDGTLKWRARLSTTDCFETPVLRNVRLDYWTD